MGDVAYYIHVRAKRHGTTKLKVPAVMEPQTNEVAATPASTSFGELLECLDIDRGIPHIPQGTF
jgi:hypothetical protein